MMSVQDIPEEILSQIFRELEDRRDILECAITCRHFRDSALPLLWHAVRVYADAWDLFRRSLGSENMTLPQNSPPKTEVNSLLFKRSAPRPAVALTMRYETLLHSLTLTASSSTWTLGEAKLSLFRRTLQRCTALTTLNLAFPAVNDNDLWIIGAACPLLQSLSLVSALSPHARVTDEGLIAIASKCPQLRELYLSSRWMDADITDDLSGRFFSKSVFTTRGLHALSNAFSGKLRGFGLRFLGIETGPASHSMDRLNQLTNASPFHRSLAKGSEMNHPLFHQSLQHLLKANPQMHTLEIDWPGLLDTVLMAVVEANFTELHSLLVGNVYDTQHLSTLLAHNRHLNKLHVTDLHVAINPSDLLQLLQEENKRSASTPNLSRSSILLTQPLHGLSNTTSTSCLRELTLDGIGYTREAVHVAAMFRHLTVLRIRPSSRAASIRHPQEDVTLAAALVQLPALRRLEAVMAGNEPPLALSEHCRALEHLDWIEGRQMTDDGVVALVRNCVCLHSLFMGSAERLSDVSILALAEHAGSRLKRLSLPFNNNLISFDAIDELSMKAVRLEGLGNLPQSLSMQELCEVLPRFKRLLVVSRCCSGGLFLTPEQLTQLKRICCSLKHVLQNA